MVPYFICLIVVRVTGVDAIIIGEKFEAGLNKRLLYTALQFDPFSYFFC